MIYIKHKQPEQWLHRIRIKHLMTSSDEAESVLNSMNAIADVLEDHPIFEHFSKIHLFRDQGDLKMANHLLDEFYDYCDSRRIWVE